MSGSSTQVSGKRAVLEAVRAGRAREILVARGTRETEGLTDVLEAARTAGVDVRRVPREELDALAEDHRGIVAQLTGGATAPKEPSERDLEEFAFGPQALVVLLDGITDPQNLGAAARVADAAGAEMLVTRRKRAAAVTDAAVRASAGALLTIPHARVANITRAIERLQLNGFTVFGLDEHAPRDVYAQAAPEGRIAIVVGAEGTGLSRLVKESCDELLSLPMRGVVGSLNASAALAATLYAFVVPRDAGLSTGPE